MRRVHQTAARLHGGNRRTGGAVAYDAPLPPFHGMKQRHASLRCFFRWAEIEASVFFFLLIRKNNVVIAGDKLRAGLHQRWQRYRIFTCQHLGKLATKLPVEIQSDREVIPLAADHALLRTHPHQRHGLPLEPQIKPVRIVAGLAAAAVDIHFVAIPLEPAHFERDVLRERRLQIEIPAAGGTFIQFITVGIVVKHAVVRMTPAAQGQIVVRRGANTVAPQLAAYPHPVMVTCDILIEKEVPTRHQVRVEGVPPAKANVKNIAIVPAVCAHLSEQNVVLPNFNRPQIVQPKVAAIASADTDICRNACFPAGMV